MRLLVALIALIVALLPSLGSCASILSMEWDSQPHFTRTVLTFDTPQGMRFQTCDRIAEDGYFYVDVYDVTTPYSQRVIDVSDPSLLKIVAVPYWDYGVVRLVFYVRERSATFDVKAVGNPGRLVCDVVLPETIAPLAGMPTGKNQAMLLQAKAADGASSTGLIIGNSGVKGYTLPTLPGSVRKRTNAPVASGRKKIIVVDPGHGGNAPGATVRGSGGMFGGRTVFEKDLNLQFSVALKSALEANPNYRVILTRTGDSSLTLSDRVKFAELQQADLFVSIHQNHADNSSARGMEVFFLSERGTSQSNVELERKENEQVGDLDFFSSRKSGILNNILADIRKSNLESLQWESFETCKQIVYGLQNITFFRQNNRGVKSANFYVLKNKQMPSILLEVGFMSNKEDLAYLVNPRFQTLTAKSLSDAIAEYFRKTELPVK